MGKELDMCPECGGTGKVKRDIKRFYTYERLGEAYAGQGIRGVADYLNELYQDKPEFSGRVVSVVISERKGEPYFAILFENQEYFKNKPLPKLPPPITKSPYVGY